MSSRFTVPKIIGWCTIFTLVVISSYGNHVLAQQDFDPGNVIAGYSGNIVPDGIKGAAITGGGQVSFPNQVLKDFGFVGGGRGNIAGNLSTVSGGGNNRAEGIRASIGGGANNTASRNSAVIAGGFGNTASQSYATIGGGNVNRADASYATISGGAGNLAIGRISVIGGGTRNRTQSAYATVGGGSFNLAMGGTSTIGGGTRNQAVGIGSTISGGAGNMAAGLQSAILGGLSNRVTDNYSVVIGGRQNVAGNDSDSEEDTPYASVGGGYENQAGGAYSVVPGGYGNQALGDYSFAAGNQAHIDLEHPGTFLFADSSQFAFESAAPDEFAARAVGGVRFVTALDANGEPLIGVRLPSGSGSWETLSDRNVKTAIKAVDGRQVLDALVEMPISTWQYKGQSQAIQHIGPMAQDFYAAFGLGQDAHYIGSVDADGVALASIQGLYRIVQDKDSQIASLNAEIVRQKEQLETLDTRLSKLEQSSDTTGAPVNGLHIVGLSFLIGLFIGNRKTKNTAVI